LKISRFLLLLFVSSVALQIRSLADDGGHDIRYVLLISVDGLHAVDVANYVKANPGSTLAELTGSTAKISEHGGFGEDDTHVALLVSLAGAPAREIKSPVETMQVAPTILQALGLDPQDLQSVQIEKTAVLPGFNLPQH
jgi:arylsulfatase A-like enzyme